MSSAQLAILDDPVGAHLVAYGLWYYAFSLTLIVLCGGGGGWAAARALGRFGRWRVDARVVGPSVALVAGFAFVVVVDHAAQRCLAQIRTAEVSGFLRPDVVVAAQRACLSPRHRGRALEVLERHLAAAF